MGLVKSHRDLIIYQRGLALASKIYVLTSSYPREEIYSMTDQTRRSSRSVCANIAEAWAKKRYVAAFKAKLNDSEAEGYETQVWLDLAVECGYLSPAERDEVCDEYDSLLKSISGMIVHAEKWCSSDDRRASEHQTTEINNRA